MPATPLLRAARRHLRGRLLHDLWLALAAHAFAFRFQALLDLRLIVCRGHRHAEALAGFGRGRRVVGTTRRQAGREQRGYGQKCFHHLRLPCRRTYRLLPPRPAEGRTRRKRSQTASTLLSALAWAPALNASPSRWAKPRSATKPRKNKTNKTNEMRLAITDKLVRPIAPAITEMIRKITAYLNHGRLRRPVSQERPSPADVPPRGYTQCRRAGAALVSRARRAGSAPVLTV